MCDNSQIVYLKNDESAEPELSIVLYLWLFIMRPRVISWSFVLEKCEWNFTRWQRKLLESTERTRETERKTVLVFFFSPTVHLGAERSQHEGKDAITRPPRETKTKWNYPTIQSLLINSGRQFDFLPESIYSFPDLFPRHSSISFLG